MIYKQYKLVLAQFYGFIGLIMIAVLSTSVKVEIDAILIWFLSVIFTIAILFFVYNRMWVWFDGIFIILSPFYFFVSFLGNDSNLLVVFYVQIMPDDFVMQLHRF